MATDQSTIQHTFWGEEDLPRKRCAKCGEVKSFGDFGWCRAKGRAPKRQSRCKACALIELKKHTEERKQKDPDGFRKGALQNARRHKLMLRGLTEGDYKDMLTAQNGVCAICGLPEKNSQKGRTEPDRLSVDHCHKTGKNRGLLCGDCNRVLGLMNDNPAWLRTAAAYLERTNGGP